jgi:hypothetical protein
MIDSLHERLPQPLAKVLTPEEEAKEKAEWDRDARDAMKRRAEQNGRPMGKAGH